MPTKKTKTKNNTKQKSETSFNGMRPSWVNTHSGILQLIPIGIPSTGRYPVVVTSGGGLYCTRKLLPLEGGYTVPGSCHLRRGSILYPASFFPPGWNPYNCYLWMGSILCLEVVTSGWDEYILIPSCYLSVGSILYPAVGTSGFCTVPCSCYIWLGSILYPACVTSR